MSITVTPITEADVHKAVFKFIEQFARPALNSSAIYRAQQNRAVLPAMSEDYAVFAEIGQYRRGTTIETFGVDETSLDGKNTYRELIEIDFQIDFYSGDDETARRRAQCIETAARSTAGTDFFKPYGIGCLYASDVKDLTGITDSDQYVPRYMTTLRLDYWTGIEVSQDWFDSVVVDLKNVDVVFPPLD